LRVLECQPVDGERALAVDGHVGRYSRIVGAARELVFAIITVEHHLVVEVNFARARVREAAAIVAQPLYQPVTRNRLCSAIRLSITARLVLHHVQDDIFHAHSLLGGHGLERADLVTTRSDVPEVVDVDNPFHVGTVNPARLGLLEVSVGVGARSQPNKGDGGGQSDSGKHRSGELEN